MLCNTLKRRLLRRSARRKRCGESNQRSVLARCARLICCPAVAVVQASSTAAECSGQVRRHGRRVKDKPVLTLRRNQVVGAAAMRVETMTGRAAGHGFVDDQAPRLTRAWQHKSSLQMRSRGASSAEPLWPGEVRSSYAKDDCSACCGKQGALWPIADNA